jgi:ribonuclease G
MKGVVIALDQIGDRDAAALIVDGVLQDFAIDPPEGAPPQAGAIFRAVADRQMKGQGGIFLKLPGGGSAFLKQTGGIAPGQRLLVQVTGHSEAGKAVPVTTRLLFKSRFAIVTPDAPGLNISRRIKDEARRAVLEALAKEGMAGAEESFGLILRSACDADDDAVIADDLRAMRDLAEKVMADLEGSPELLVDAPGAHELAWRDWVEPAPDEVADGRQAFGHLGVLELLDALRRPIVALGGGASMAVEPTRALVAVDVNTGADTSPAAALKANIAAARDLPRQLKLRGLGGQVVVDFAPMPKRDRAVLDQVLKSAFRHDGAETTLAGWTLLGNYELQRKRERMPLSESLPE